MSEHIIWESDGIEVQGHRVTQHEKREEIVRCRDCANASLDEFGRGWCNENCREITPWDFCAWGRKEGAMNNADYLATAKKHISEITFWSNLIKDVSGNEFVKVVRCHDCKHHTEDDMEYYHYCGNWCEQVEPNGFCAWGVRKDGDAR